MLATKECKHLAAQLFAETIARHGIEPGLQVHADRGSAMKSDTLAPLLTSLGASHSFRRPRVSDDSAYREHPERFPNGPPRVPRPPSAVSINPLAIDALSVQPDPSGDDRIHTLSLSTEAAYQTAIAS